MGQRRAYLPNADPSVYKNIFTGLQKHFCWLMKDVLMVDEIPLRRERKFPTLETKISNVGFRFFLPGFEVAAYLDGNISAERDIREGHMGHK